MLSIFDGLRDMTTLSITLRLVFATLCGGAIGMERTYKRRPAGFRTHILICVGACMTTLTSQYLYLVMHYFTDMARLGAQVVAGIGFIGAGSILVTQRRRVKGLTTAAGLWAAAIIGLCIGGGFFEGGLLATVFIVLIELLFSRLEYRMLRKVPEINLFIEYSEKQGIDNVMELCREKNVHIVNMEITRKKVRRERSACALMTLRFKKHHSVEALIAAITAAEGIVSVEEL